MKINKTYIKNKGFLPLFFLLAFLGCKKESTKIGTDLRDDKGGINSVDVSYTDISTRTVPGDSFFVDNLNANILGVINDPVFGLRKASLVVQPKLAEAGNDLGGKTADSVLLVLRYDKEQLVGGFPNQLVYGDTTSVIALDIYKLSQDLDDTSRYYNNFRPQLGDQIGSYMGKFNVNASKTIIIDEDTVDVAPELIIRLDQAFAQELMDLGEEAYSGNDAFVKALKGIVIVPRNNTVSGEGAIVGIETRISASGLLLHYSDSLTKGFPLTSSSHVINYQETIPTSDIVNQSTDPRDYSRTYVQSSDGTKVLIDVPELNAIIESADDVVINEAEISIVVDQAFATSAYPVPSRTWLQVPDTAGGVVGSRSIPIQDLYDDIQPPSGWIGYTNYGGDYNGEGYNFHFNRYLQALVTAYRKTGVNHFHGFYLSVPSDYPVIPARAVLDTDKASEKVKVSVTYTKLN